MRISLLIVATNKYIQYVPALLESAKTYFMKDCEVTYHVFTDQNHECLNSINVRRHEIAHKPHPYPTLYRYHFFGSYSEALEKTKADYFFYIDADCLVKAPVHSDILSERVVTKHCGFINQRGSYEKNKKSTSYVAPHEGTHYFGGGFWGFSSEEFWKFIETATLMIETDEAAGIVPEWHDESVLNRYMIDNEPTKILPHAYHYPEGQINYYRKLWQGIDYEPIILLLDKNHEEVRA